MDIVSSWALFTWWNNQPIDPVGKKLDSILINPEWLNTFPNAFVNFEAGGISDHSRSLVRLSQSSTPARKPFRFFNYLVDHPQFHPTVSCIWNENSSLYHSRFALHRFHKQLKHLTFKLRLTMVTYLKGLKPPMKNYTAVRI